MLQPSMCSLIQLHQLKLENEPYYGVWVMLRLAELIQ